MKCVPGLTVRRLCGYSERKIDIYCFAKSRRRVLTGNGGKQRKLEWPPDQIVKLV